MEALKDFLLNGLVTLLFTLICSLGIAAIKKGNFENWGIAVGKFLDKIGRAKLGTDKWEKIEDVLTVAMVSFVHGIKKGADWDDEEVKNLLETGTRQPAPEELK